MTLAVLAAMLDGASYTEHECVNSDSSTHRLNKVSALVRPIRRGGSLTQETIDGVCRIETQVVGVIGLRVLSCRKSCSIENVAIIHCLFASLSLYDECTPVRVDGLLAH